MAISFVKSFSMKSSPGNSGYQNQVGQPDTVSDTEDDDAPGPMAADKDVAFDAFAAALCAWKPQPGEPFSLLTPSMWPQDVLAALSQPEDSRPPFQFDAYGFVLEDDVKVPRGCASLESGEDAEPDEEGDGDEEDEAQEEGERRPECERASMFGKREEQLRAKWIAFLEFNYNESALPRMKWSQVEMQIRHNKVLDELVKGGLPHSMRPQLWLHFSKGLTLRNNSKWTYSSMCDQSNHVEPLSDEQMVRILPSNVCFTNSSSVGVERLRRLLRVVKWLQRNGSDPVPSSTTAESVNVSVIAAHLLLVCDEEDAFWLLLSCISELKSFDHQSLLKYFISQYCRDADSVIKSNDIEISLITVNWFSSLFASVLPKSQQLFLFWDCYFYYGSIVLFQLTVGLLLKKSKLLTNRDSAELFNMLSDLPSHITSNSQLLKYWSAGNEVVHHVRFSDKPEGSSSQAAPGLHTSSAILSLPSFNEGLPEKPEQEIRTKNVRQTSMLVELNEAISAIGHHFESYDPDFRAQLVPDYDNMERSDEEFDSGRPQRSCRRAKALIDFQRHDPDELGFRRNDILTIVSERDEHCWIGELNGLRGWFPAKFVELLDERNGDYHVAGDDRVVPFINDLVRGRFCNAFKTILNYGLKKTMFVTMHPWNVLETIASACIESDFNSVYSRLVLTKTFRLDEFARVLTPSEMLYRSIAHINKTHEHEPMDIKLRSLVCIALNQQILHDWFTVICAMQPHVLSRYYTDWSYVNSPAWRLIRAELRLLTQFTFNLNPNAELADASLPKSPVSKDGVRDMLVKHHLFSWDI